ncbi:uncharacterized protein RAG0_01589 [Rhynchosporium agropyri]|uniref:Uncharacterized protein n=1 Tax=Rhynchosporium agropyri TaxID=914238 RepID=A0A1E1JXH4_9HELO|nr:uncharacterized protein RAG0_01589 [Rhynchosporium agropyri]
MCVETTTVYGNCRAVRVHLSLCAAHIEHTRLQLDMSPCPFFQKNSIYGGITSRCDCKYSPFINAGEIVCQRALSKGYGENGFTWSFDKGPSVVMKGKKDTARQKAKKEKMEKMEKMEMEREKEKEKEKKLARAKMEEGDEEQAWKASGWGGFGGFRSQNPENDPSSDSYLQKPKKVKIEKNHNQAKLEPLDEDVEM